MIDRPYVILSAAMSLDGYLDTASPPRLALSNAADFDRVDEVRAHCDAILVGARTVRADNPRLLVRSEERRSRREAQGLPPSPWKVTVTTTGDLDPQSKFFTFGDTKKLVYCPRSAVRGIRDRLGDRATVVGLGDEVSVADLVSELNDRGVRTLLVEGGGTVFTQFLAADLVDELQLAIAPFFVGDRASSSADRRRHVPMEFRPPRAPRREPSSRRHGAPEVRTVRALPRTRWFVSRRIGLA